MKNKGIKNQIKQVFTFKDVYFPLENYHSKVFANGHMAFDFPQKWLYENCDEVSIEDQDKIIDILNGKDNSKSDLELTYKDATIYQNGKEFIIIRGWGHLTGCGGLNLNEDEAVIIQDDFANYIIEKLTKTN